MGLEKILNENLINLDLQAKNKDEAIRELTAMLQREGKLSDAGQFIRDVYKREAEGRTGLGNHIAIPHGKSMAVLSTAVAIGRTSHALEWESLDDKPVHFIILFAVRNVDETTVHLKLLAKVAAALADEDNLQKLLRSNDKKEVIKTMSKEE
ncbi:hypothetical protein P22_2788 [Propionispora sp. 2/2-37]|uniref:PTS sugar transporter subunit IIA n=1 Tax=Propionispora sp. 2/2-37 TaxID=1677858 RepID=UPI0006BB6CFB|nr:fructose PTS transporter subunit IIA [Propionispora sp. 2/2-37]CUH96698.1 hypothetical protein P22_2788 [Propionispora sp. 2/2-37]